jgi:hypothetical protein
MHGRLQQQTQSSSQLMTFLKINFKLVLTYLITVIFTVNHMYDACLNQYLVDRIEYT